MINQILELPHPVWRASFGGTDSANLPILIRSSSCGKWWQCISGMRQLHVFSGGRINAMLISTDWEGSPQQLPRSFRHLLHYRRKVCVYCMFWRPCKTGKPCLCGRCWRATQTVKTKALASSLPSPLPTASCWVLQMEHLKSPKFILSSICLVLRFLLLEQFKKKKTWPFKYISYKYLLKHKADYPGYGNLNSSSLIKSTCLWSLVIEIAVGFYFELVYSWKGAESVTEN